MKYIKKYENNYKHNYTHGYWLVATDDRLENSIVNLFKQYKDNKYIVEVIDEALNIADEINEMVNTDYIYITMNLSNASFSYHPYNNGEKIHSPNYVYLGKINIEDYELDSKKYNL